MTWQPCRATTYATKRIQMKRTPIPRKHPPNTFPDDATCRIRASVFEGSIECVSQWRAFCPHHLSLESTHFCQHPMMLAKGPGGS